ncbi:NAD(P)-binding rossmann-fold protein, partial [Trifolium pratense]
FHHEKFFCTEYEKSKVATDKIALQAASEGVPIVLLYPGVIYGPDSENVRFSEISCMFGSAVPVDGEIVRITVHWIGCSFSNRASSWWKDICSIDVREDGSWFAKNMSRRLGNGNSTRFWLDCWFDNLPLCERFPRLFSISTQKDGMVSNFWVEREGVWGWEMGWRRRLFVWEEDLYAGFRDVLPV